METSTRKKCEAYAEENSLIFGQYFYREHRARCYRHTIELPKGLYTQGGNTGYSSEDLLTVSVPHYWFLVLEEMRALVEESPWLTIEEAQAKGLSV